MKTHPLNLAVFRIAVFLSLMVTTIHVQPVWYAGLPQEFLTIPFGLKSVLSHLPITPGIMSAVYPLLLVSCITGALGLFTRVSALIAALCGAYALGVPQVYAKLSHYHELIWFCLLLAAAPSADFFAVDAAVRAARRADKGVLEPPGPARIYELAVRIVLVLLGLVYFFPGFWKLYASGIDWFLTDNLKWQLHRKWVEIPGWEPFFRVDRYPVLYKSMGFFTIVFEIGFIFAAFFRPLRPWLAVSGLAFHNATNAFMQIPFWHVQACYVVLFDWDAIFKKLGRAFYRDPLYLIYDAQCKLCRRAAAALRVFDVFGRIEYVSLQDRPQLEAKGCGHLSETALMKDIHAVVRGKAWLGYEAYRRAAWRVLPLWPFLPILYLFPVAAIGRRIYRRVADSRTCSVPGKDPAAAPRAEERPRQSAAAAVLFVGGFLIAVNVWFGARNIHSWPFSVFPTFEHMMGGSVRAGLWIEPVDEMGNRLEVDDHHFARRLTPARWYRIKENALARADDPAALEAYLRALWELIRKEDPAAGKAAKIRFYTAGFTGNPDERDKNPIKPVLIFEMDGSAASLTGF